MGFLNKYIFVNDNKSVKEAASIVTQVVTKAVREHNETLKDISEAEIKSKDRVDISLAEYELLKKENRTLRERCMHMEDIFKRIALDPKLIEKVDPSTVIKFRVLNDPIDFTSLIRIEFKVSQHDLEDI